MRRELVASLAPGTCRDRLWLLPSGPDQVHQTAMRGGPPPSIVSQRTKGVRKRAVSLQSVHRTYPANRSILLHRVPDARWFNAQRAKARRAFFLMDYHSAMQLSAQLAMWGC